MFVVKQITDDETIEVGSCSTGSEVDNLVFNTMQSIVDELTETGQEGFVIDEEDWVIWKDGEIIYAYVVHEE